MVNHTNRGRFSEPEAIVERVRTTDINDSEALSKSLQAIGVELVDGTDIDNVERQLKKGYTPEDLYSLLFSLEYLDARYSIRIKGRELTQLTPGERGSVLLVFYLLADKDDRPLIIDQPEENLDNQSLYELVVPCIEEAKKRRQIIMVTHNPNLAVVCDAEQIIWCHIDKEQGNTVTYQSGSLENPTMNKHVVDVLEGTWPAFRTRTRRYQE
jgi:predicted ATPase